MEQLLTTDKIYIEIPVSLIEFNGKPAILLRKTIYEKEKVKRFAEILSKQEKIEAVVYFPDLFKTKLKMIKLGLIK